MQYNKLYADSFKYGLMFGKKVCPGDSVFISVVDKGDVMLALKKAYFDMSPRTFKNKSKENKSKIDQKEKRKLLEKLANKFVEFFKDPIHKDQPQFDDWHKKICEFFIERYKEILVKSGKIEDQATFGKAQKIINMTFKYLYCFDDAEKYIEKFEHCHMPLDHYILDWFRDKYNEGKKGQEKLTKTVVGKKLPSWSDLKYKKENQDDFVPQYEEIQKEIRSKLAGKNVLESEFLIWYNERGKEINDE